MKKILSLIVLLTACSPLFAQQQVDMADVMHTNGKIYVVVGTIAIVFVGLAIYLFMMDSRLRKLERTGTKTDQ